MGETVFTLLFLLAVCASAQGQNLIQMMGKLFQQPYTFQPRTSAFISKGFGNARPIRSRKAGF